jgi:hypothetical protein
MNICVEHCLYHLINYAFRFAFDRPESVRPIQGVPSVIRLSPSPRQWGGSNPTEQPSVILQHALTSSTNQSVVDGENTQIQSGKTSTNIFRIVVSDVASGTVYCVMPQPHEKSVMVIKNEMDNEAKENKSFQRQVSGDLLGL